MVMSRTCHILAIAAACFVPPGAYGNRYAKALSFLHRQPAENQSLASLADVPLGPPMDPLEKITREALSAKQEVTAHGASGETPMERIMREAAESEEEEKKEHANTPDKPMMDGIEIFRVQMCLGRPAVSLHKKCMKFLTKHCKIETTAKGYCEDLKHKLIEGCKVHKRKEACGACKKLGYPGECGIVEEKAVTTTTTTIVEEEDYDEDSDGDGVPDNLDAFPDDPSESEDHDNDGIGDNTDPTPYGEPQPVHVEEPIKTNSTNGTNGTIPPLASDGGTNKKYRKLPSQGFDEHSNITVMYRDNDQQSADWLLEHGQTIESEEEATARICKEYPDHPWCRLYLKAHV